MSPLDLDFARDGAVVLRGAFDAADIADRLWGFLERRYGQVRGDRTTWSGKLGKGLSGFAKTKGLAPIMTDAIRGEITRLLGPVWTEPNPWRPLVTFPRPGEWSIPTGGWHVDFPPSEPMPAVRMFGYLASVAPGGGGTLIAAGSHRLVAHHAGKSSAEIREAIGDASRWFHDLWWPNVANADRMQRYMVEGAVVEGVPVRVVELTGEPGDVVLWHPSLYHCIAPNCRDTPRFMFTHTAERAV